MELTPEQRAIVEAGDVDLAVSAGAGSGKTHVLVERYIRLLDRCAIPEIVAVTFTEAAAAEMRQRVRREVMTRPELSGHLPRLDEAIIGTIHSLCLRLLRESPVEAGIDPSSTVLAEDEGELLRRIACALSIDAAAEVGDVRTEALRSLGVRAASLMLPPMLALRDDVAAAFAAMPEAPDEIARHTRAALEEACATYLDPLRRTVPGMLLELRAGARDSGDKLAVALDNAMLCLGEPEDGDASEWGARLAEARRYMVVNVGRGDAWDTPVADVKQAIRETRAAVDDALSAAPLWNEADAASAAALPALRLLFEDACARYEEAKRERHALDFLDLEVRAVALLEEYPDVAEACRHRFRLVMVDEAQDVSPIQARLVR
ncbi:MAG: UvrD-helicase domain-containing protein, partial [Dehalococcoidia bacterium]